MKDGTTSLKYVDHTYHDFSNYIIEGGELTKHKKSHNNFPARLHRLLSSGHDDVITWMVRALYLLSCVWPILSFCAYHVFAHIICFPLHTYQYTHHISVVFTLRRGSHTAERGRSSIENVSDLWSFLTITFASSMNHLPANWMVGASSVSIKLVQVCVWYGASLTCSF